jgi:hypothetical protein
MISSPDEEAEGSVFIVFAYNATRPLGIEHTPFEANCGFSLEESRTYC